MKKLDIFVLRSFIGPLILTFFIVLIILILQFLWMYIDELAGKGLELKIIAELLFQFTLSFVPTAFPLAILLAALMTFGNMGEFSELTALKSSGIPLERIMRPLMILIVFISVISFFFSNNVLPFSNRKARTLLYDIRRKRPDINIQAGTFNNDIDGFSIKVTTKDPYTNLMEKLIIYDHRDRRGNVSVIYADSGYMKVSSDETALIMVLYNGYSYNELQERNVSNTERKYPSRMDRFEEQTLVLSLSGFDLERSTDDIFKSHSAMLNISELTYHIDSLNKRYNTRIDQQFEEFTKTKIYTERYNLSHYVDEKIAASSLGDNRFDPAAILDTLPPMEKAPVVSSAIEKLKEGSSFLSQKNESLYIEVKNIKKYEIDWNRKFTLSFACLVFFFIGAPLGAIIRKGGLGTPAVISILFFVIWYVISLSGEKLVAESRVDTIAGMWASSYILLPVGIFLTYKASTDSVMMNIETYLAFLKKIKDYFYRLAITGFRDESAQKEL
ncbi:MAG: LptF/LptG family permease [Bacteroidales bacterium]|nr:LptF/LptG family permease [Bacteroidales bacterium]